MTTSDTWQRLEAARVHVAGCFPAPPHVAVVLGSGLGDFVDSLSDARSLSFSEVPHMPASGVAGHAGRLWSGTLAGRRVIVMQGRVHLYEGHAPADVVFGVRLMLRLGAQVLVVTNAAGGIGQGFSPGMLACIEDHINLTGRSCLEGPNEPQLGPRFPDMTRAYDPALIALAKQVADEQGIPLLRGVYAGVLGPSYETPAEIRMLRTLGADLVGMSTVQEVIAARHAGTRVLGLSCVTNYAAGLSPERLDHADVQRQGAAAASTLCRLVAGVIEGLSASEDGDE